MAALTDSSSLHLSDPNTPFPGENRHSTTSSHLSAGGRRAQPLRSPHSALVASWKNTVNLVGGDLIFLPGCDVIMML